MMTLEKWYALRVYYGGNQKVLRIKGIFDSDGIETFVPMTYSSKPDPLDSGRPLEVPALKELVMVKTSEEMLNEVRVRHMSSRDMRFVDFYRYRHGEHKGLPIEIPERQMLDFINFAKANQNSINYYTDEQLQDKKGRPVEVIAGQFKGLRGQLMRIEKNRHVVIVLPDVLGASLPHIPVSMLRFIDE